MKRVFLGLGTNMGDRQQNLADAIDALAKKMEMLRRSSVYETKAWGYTEQADFLNMVVEAKTELKPLALLNFLKRTESELGRVANFRYGPRVIDIDILFYEDLVRNTPRLQIPHPRLHERAFVLVPMVELAADLTHPILNRSMSELLKDVDGQEVRLCE